MLNATQIESLRSECPCAFVDVGEFLQICDRAIEGRIDCIEWLDKLVTEDDDVRRTMAGYPGFGAGH